MRKLLQILPLDPIISRDGRPFDLTPGTTAYSLRHFSPSMIAGSIRTIFYKYISEHKDKFGGIGASQFMSALKIRGPLYIRNGKKFFPFPEDMYVYEESPGRTDQNLLCEVRFLAPQNPNQSEARDGYLGVGKPGLFEEKLWPVDVPAYKKVWKDKPVYISEDLMIKWLMSNPDQDTCTYIGELITSLEPDQTDHASHFLASFPLDLRTHTEISSDTQVAQDQNLFSTQAIVMPEGLTMQVEVQIEQYNNDWDVEIFSIHSMGGKRRLTHFQELTDQTFGDYPEEIGQALEKAKYIRMVLATPAYFAKGWCPGWLDESLRTNQKWKSNVGLQLLWACIPGSEPYSGWSYSGSSKGTEKAHEKAIRRMVPAGSVYYFKVTDGNARELAERMWLISVSDEDRRKGSFDSEDGFGLALWGVWCPDKM